MSSHALLPGADGAHITTPDHASLDIASIDFRIELAPTDWTAVQYLASRWSSAGNRVFLFYLDSGGIITYVRTTDGTNALTVPATEGVGFSANQRAFVRVFHDPTTTDVIFYSSLDGGNNWTQVGATVVIGASSIFAASNSPIDIGRNNQSAGLGNYLNAKVYRMSIRTAAGTLICSPDFRQMSPGQTTTVDSTGKTWTLAGTSSVVGAPDGGFTMSRGLELGLGL